MQNKQLSTNNYRFQHRIKLFRNRTLKLPSERTDITKTDQPTKSSAKERCIACNPDKFINQVIIYLFSQFLNKISIFLDEYNTCS